MTRVKKKSFLLITFLTPLGFLLFFGAVILIFSYRSDDKVKVYLSDPHSILNESDLETRRFDIEKSTLDIESLKKSVTEEKAKGVLLLPFPDTSEKVGDYTYTFYSDEQLDLESSMVLNKKIKQGVKNFNVRHFNIDTNMVSRLNQGVEMDIENITEKGERIGKMTGAVSAAIGGVMGYIMFFVILLFGTQVMRNVAEEKINRIVEVIISSVKPFELMLAKILGTSAVSLTQLLIWMIFIPIFGYFTQMFMPDPSAEMTGLAMEAAKDTREIMPKINMIFSELSVVNWWLIIPLFLFYFITGFLLYSSIFAAIGAALGDDVNDAQVLTLPVVMPIMFAVYILMQVIREPNSSMAVWSSIIPFFSPIIMPARLPYNPDWWQIGLSMFLALASALVMIWIAGRIYRVGILMYGKKATFADLFKWIFTKA